MQNADRFLVVFGTDHSPWVQTVLLACDAYDVRYQLKPFPPSVLAFLRYGLVMPICRFSDGTYTSDSFRILEELGRRYGGPRVSDADLSEQRYLERVFIAYVLSRAPRGRRLTFFNAWSKKRDSSDKILWTALRALVSIYFFVLIIFGQRSLNRMKVPLFQEGMLREAFARWSDILEKQPYLGGDKPSAADFGLLGQFQCMASGLTDQTLPLVLEYPGLMLWLETMHHRVDGYERLHSLRFIDPNSTVKSAHLSSQIYFYIALSLAILAFPITFIFLVYALLKRGKNASRTGALSSTW